MIWQGKRLREPTDTETEMEKSMSTRNSGVDEPARSAAEVGFLPVQIRKHPLIAIASDLSLLAWTQMRAWGPVLGRGLDANVVDTKTSANDLVTEADAQIEALVRGYLAAVRPGDLMVGEEGSSALDPVEFFDSAFLQKLEMFDPARGELAELEGPIDDHLYLEWHVDPIDGTVNFVRGIEHHAFSVGVRVGDGSQPSMVESGSLVGVDGHDSFDAGVEGDQFAGVDGRTSFDAGWLAGLVASPGLESTWVGLRGQGAFVVPGLLSDHQNADATPASALSGTPRGLSGRVLATGFAYKRENRSRQLTRLPELLANYDDIRRCGSAAIDLCMVAEGKVNAYVERGLGVYDYAGGALIAEEAGVIVRRGGAGGPTAAADSAAEVDRLREII